MQKLPFGHFSWVPILSLCGLLAGGCVKRPLSSGQNGADAAFEQTAREYMAGFRAWRPQTGTALGFHEYDGKITDLSRPSLDAELARLKSFDSRLTGLDPRRLSKRAAYDYRILQGTIRREIFGF